MIRVFLAGLVLSGMVLLEAYSQSKAYSQPVDSITTIRAFLRVSDELASSGYVQEHEFSYISQAGFSHVISLLPGDQSREENLVRAAGMSFTNIGVDWNNPGQKDLEAYFNDMNSHSHEKVYLHCEANMRASAFLFLYRVIRLGTDKKVARAALDSMWYPTGKWHSFIEEALEKHGLDPEYRFEPDFVKLIREEGVSAAGKELSRLLARGEELPFSESDLNRVAMDHSANKRTDEAIRIYTMSTQAFPGSWKAHSQLGDILINSGDEAGAMPSWERVIELDPDNLWAKRMLGRLGSQEHEVYWKGRELVPEIAESLAGTYDLGNSTLEFSAEKDGFFLETSWNKKKFKLYSDSRYCYFIHENNWMFEFPEGEGQEAGEVSEVNFILPGRTLRGKKIR